MLVLILQQILLIKKTSLYKGSDSRTVNDQQNEGYNWTNNLIWRKRFQRKGRTFFASFSSNINNNQITGINSIQARFYDSKGKIYKKRSSDYQTYNDFKRSDNVLTFSYTEPLSRSNILEFNYGFRNNKDEADRSASLYNTATKQYDKIEDSLTNLFSNENRYHRIGTNWRGINKKYNYQIGFTLQQVFMESQNKSKRINLGKQFFNIIPLVTFNYKLANNKNIQVNYRGRSNQPALSQLQDITDISSYPYIRKGNPDLKQEFTHNLMFTYNSFSMPKMHTFFATMMYNNTRNKIVNSIVQTGGEQVLKPINVNGVDHVTGTFTYSLPINQLEGGNFSSTSTIEHLQQKSFINYQANKIKNFSLEQEINVNFNYKEKIDVVLNVGISFNSVSYSIQKDQNSSYLMHNYSVDVSYNLSNDFFISTVLNYTGFTGDFSNNNQNFLLWNASITKQIFKNRSGAFSLSVHDLLNQNRYISRNVYDNTIEDIQSLALKRFALITFTYYLNQTGKNKIFKKL